MKLRKKEKCAICKAFTDFPEAHFLDFHYGRGKNARISILAQNKPQ